MRTTVACERKSKVKCHHTGSAPCRGCLRSGSSSTCILTPTIATSLVHSRTPQIRKKRLASSASLSAKTAARKRNVVDKAASTRRDLASHFTGIDGSVFTQAIAVFRVHFPEYGFLHPSDLDRVSVKVPDDDKLRLIAILAVSCRYLGESVDARRAEHLALLTQELQCRITAPPTLSLIHCFLIMALCEWGEGIGYSAWMYGGIAARMAQVYRATKIEASKSDPRSISNRPPLSEVEIRTMWTYFAIDKLLSCGKQRPAMMKPEDIEVRMPQAEEDFVFGIEPQESLSFEDLVGDPTLRKRTSTSGFLFCILVRGLDIWHKIHSWIVDGGRKQPKMTEPDNCPWNSTSQWAKLKQQLQQWREDQDSRLKYPETKVTTHVHFRQGEVFAYINLLYYLNVAFICREFIPLLPAAEQEPRGPIDPPFYSEEAPPGWWRQNTDELFDAAAQISYIMRDLNSLDIAIHTPFTGLCVFTAALLNGYATAFPHMHYLREQSLRRQLAAENLNDLEKIAKLWKLGEEWVQVVGAAQNLSDRVVNNRAQFVGHSRYEYPELENSVHYAPIGGIYGDKLDNSLQGLQHRLHVDWAALANSRRRSARVIQDKEAEQLASQPSDQHVADPFAGFDADMTNEDWRLWSFWDDPHLLSWDTSTIGI
ncbi:hypothetical protein F5Y19DRAFT_269157 [Xylariaceae sp. FL1651]|nr:hypothetical protein F5Y19DRAFT_269157 [Xylariaceae sp. FL1651]